MTVEEVLQMAKVIKAYYPSIQLLNNPIDVQIWADEFKDYNFDLAIKATRNLCKRNENSFCVNIYNIQNEYKDLKMAILEEERKNARENIIKIEVAEELPVSCPEHILKKFESLFGRKFS